MSYSGTVFLANPEVRVSELAGTVSARILRTGSLANEVKITYGVTGNTATDGQDFLGGFGTVIMPAGASEVSVPVRILDDAVGEASEVLVFSLVNVEGAGLFAPRTSRITILDNETPAPPPPAEPPLSTDYNVQQIPVLNGLNLPLSFEFSPVDPTRAYIVEKGGGIRIANMNTGQTNYVIDLSSRTNEHLDRGLIDIALHPDFVRNPYLYAFLVVDPADTAGKGGNAAPDAAGNRYSQVLRFTLDASTGYSTVVAGSEVVLLGKGGRSLADISGGGAQDFTDPTLANAISSERYVNPAAPVPLVNGFKQDYLKVDSASHAGGALAFGPDGALYVSTGDGTSFDYADPRSVDVLSVDSLSGKILRVDPLTGRGLADNPFATADVSLDSNRAKVFQSGLRNPFAMTFNAEGQLFITNTGWNSYEMINSGGPGANFGWPYFEGGDNGTLLRTPGYRDLPSANAFYDSVANGTTQITPAFRAFAHDSSAPGFQVQAITGSEGVYSGNVYPTALKGDLFFSDFSQGEVYTVDTSDRTDVKFLYFANGPVAPVHFVQGPDGYMYYADISMGQVGRLLITALPTPPAPAGAKNTTIGSGPDTLVMRISQDAYQGSALYTISVDGKQVGDVQAASGLRASGQVDVVTVLGDWATGDHEINVTFLNDAFGGTAATDRNLYIEGATYNGVAVADSNRALPAGPARIAFADTGAPTTPTPTGPTTTTIGAGPDTLVLRISQDAYQGSAQYTVSVDGVQIGGPLTAAALNGSGQSDTVNVLGNWAAGNHNVVLNYLNDTVRGTVGADRNLYVDSVTYNGAAVTGVPRNVPAGTSNFTFTEAAAPPPSAGPTTTTIGIGPDTLVLRITQDAYQGNAQYTVSVDGVRIEGVLTASALRGSGQSDTLNVLGNWAAGSHNVVVTFLNDAYGGSTTADRNLYIEGATYNGVAVSGAQQDILSGSRNFSFTEAAVPPTTPPPSGGTGSVTIGTGPDTLVMRISQDAYQGSAQYTVSVDGTQIGGALTAVALNSSGQFDTVTVLGDFAAGNHNVVVNFFNDAFAPGVSGADRNLYILGATYNGITVSNVGQIIYAGNGGFGFTETATTTPPPTPPASGTATATIGSGPDTLVLRIAQDAYNGNAQYTVSVDGTQIGGVQTATALNSSGSSDTLNVLGDFAAGNHNVVVNFLNDAYGGTATTDRNLYVKSATYNGAAVSGAQQDILSGSKAFGFTDTATTTPPASGGTGGTTIGSGADTLVLRISQDAYQGSAQYTVSVDGTQIGGTLTAATLHSTGQSDIVNVLGNFAAGNHNVVINFLNDAFAPGVAGADRNLYVDSATYNGAMVSNAGRVIYAGSSNFSFTDTATTPPATTPPTGPTTTTVGTGSDALVMRISQDFYQGSAQYTVKVDGTQVGGTLTASGLHGSNQADTLNVRGNWAPGNHSIVVEFINDAFAPGVAGADRNLYIDSATYNGATVNGAGAVLYAGTASFTVNDLSPIG